MGFERFESLYKIRKVIDAIFALMKEVENLTSDKYKILIHTLKEALKEKEKK